MGAQLKRMALCGIGGDMQCYREDASSVAGSDELGQ
jgi:hypothetical protein